ncbi:Glycosyl hydrolases family 32 N-terminal domain containing protein [Novymonas esmeraldas]|uniref:Glycosyl hydrolases family 32 N-terminal domain containing protein n=1 Tax=Novymonas esmeraldas TaxID=1808958 RepID=A0AAW0ERP4_9TRYP
MAGLWRVSDAAVATASVCRTTPWVRRLTALVAGVVWLAAVLAAALPYEPIFHPRPPRGWVGGPAAAYRDAATQKVHLYMLYNPSATTNVSAAWYHVTSSDYAYWTREDPPTAISADRWYDTDGVLSGVMMNNGQNTPVALYTCEDSGAMQRQCLANPTSADVAGRRLFNTLVKSPVNPVIGADSVPQLVSRGAPHDPTEWWTNPAASGQWLIAFAARQSTSSGLRSSVVVFATSDTSLQGGYTFSHSLYDDTSGGGGGGVRLTAQTLERPDFFTLTGAGATSGAGERFLKLSVAEWRRDLVVYGAYAAAASNAGQYIFTADTARRATVVDYGCLYGGKTFYDPIQRRRRMWGWIQEDLAPSSVGANGWAGMQTIRDVVYDTTENKLRFPPIREMQALRASRVAWSTGLTVTSAAATTVLTGSSSLAKYQEVIATFYIPPGVFDGSKYFAANPPEFGMRVRASADASRYVTVAVRMPIANATPTRGYRQPGTVLQEVAVSDDVDAAGSCATQCLQAVPLCEAWNLRLNASGSYCSFLSTPAPLEVDCTAQTSLPNVPLLLVERAASSSIGSLTSVGGRAPLTVAHPSYVKLHLFIDDSAIEVYKDDGTEVVSSRVYLPGGDSLTGVSLYTRNMDAITADVTVFTMSSMWAAAAANNAATRANSASVL